MQRIDLENSLGIETTFSSCSWARYRSSIQSKKPDGWARGLVLMSLRFIKGSRWRRLRKLIPTRYSIVLKRMCDRERTRGSPGTGSSSENKKSELTFDNFVQDLRIILMDCEYADPEDILMDAIIVDILNPGCRKCDWIKVKVSLANLWRLDNSLSCHASKSMSFGMKITPNLERQLSQLRANRIPSLVPRHRSCKCLKHVVDVARMSGICGTKGNVLQ